MAKDLIPFTNDDDDDLQLPAHVLEAFAVDGNNELAGGLSGGYPVITYRGKVWSIVEGGERHGIYRNNDPDDPAPYIDVVIIKANPALSKVYYEGGWVEGSAEKPTCYSNDGKAPAPDAAEPQNSSCLTCKHNIWGSRIAENGSKGKACADSRRLCVAPIGDLERVMLLRVPAASLRSLANYADMLKRRKAPYQAVVTRIGFDRDAAHPQFTFKAIGWLDAEDAATVAEVMKRDIVQQITGTEAPATALEGASTPKTKATVGVEEVEAALKDVPDYRAKRQPNLAVVKNVKEVLVSDDEETPKKTRKTTARKVKPVEDDEVEEAPKSSKAADLIKEVDSELDALLADHFNS